MRFLLVVQPSRRLLGISSSVCLSPACGSAGQPCPVTLRLAGLPPSLLPDPFHSAACCPSASPSSQEPRWGVRAVTLPGLLVSCCPGEPPPAALPVFCGHTWVRGVLSCRCFLGVAPAHPSPVIATWGVGVVRPRCFLPFSGGVCRPTFKHALPCHSTRGRRVGKPRGSRERPQTQSRTGSFTVSPRCSAGVSCEPGSAPGTVGTAGDRGAPVVFYTCRWLHRETRLAERSPASPARSFPSVPSRCWWCHGFGQCAHRAGSPEHMCQLLQVPLEQDAELQHSPQPAPG